MMEGQSQEGIWRGKQGHMWCMLEKCRANSCFERFLGLQCGEKTFRVYMRSDMRVFPTFNSS